MADYSRSFFTWSFSATQTHQGARSHNTHNDSQKVNQKNFPAAPFFLVFEFTIRFLSRELDVCTTKEKRGLVQRQSNSKNSNSRDGHYLLWPTTTPRMVEAAGRAAAVSALLRRQFSIWSLLPAFHFGFKVL